MADPLSVAGSAVGIISLGIQVAQSLFDYYNAVKSQHTDVAHTIRKLDSLLEILGSLQHRIDGRRFRADEQDAVQKIESLINESEECIQELQDEAEKFKQCPVNTVQSAFRTTARRVAYPFRRSTLEKLDEDVDDIVDRLKLALQLLQQEVTDRVQDDVEDIKALLNLVKSSQDSSRIQQWLNAPDATINFNEACAKRQPRTGLWLVKGQRFTDWLTSHGSFLWLRGFAGCGKSVLCSTAIQHTYRHRRSNPQTGIAFFFFTFNDENKQDTSALLRALVLQLSTQVAKSSHLARLRDSYRQAAPPNEALLGCLRQLIGTFQDVYILIDALDESPRDKHREAVLQLLTDLRAWQEPRLHLLVTSRDEVDIRDELDANPSLIIEMRNSEVDQDINAFICQTLQDDRKLVKWKKHHSTIQDALAQQANGMFRWVECQFRSLARCPPNQQLLEQLLHSLPKSLDDTYARMLENIAPDLVDYAKQMLTILCCAIRPLSDTELLDALAVRIDSDCGHDYSYDVTRRFNDISALEEICPGFIEVDTVYDTDVNSDDQSLYESDDEPDYDPDNDSDYDSDYDTGYYTDGSITKGFHSINTFRKIRRGFKEVVPGDGNDDGTDDDTDDSTNDDTGGDTGNHIGDDTGDGAPRVTIQLAHFSVQEFLEAKRILRYQDIAHFHVERQLGHTQMAGICLASLLYPQQKGKKALSEATKESALLRYAARHWPEHYTQCASKAAIEMQSLPLFQATSPFFMRWVRTWNIDSYYGSLIEQAPEPLYYVAFLGLTTIAAMLLGSSSMNVKSPQAPDNDSPMYAINRKETSIDHIHVLKSLSEDSDIETKGGYGSYGTALNAAAAHGHKSTVQLLLDNGADIDAGAGESRTALHSVAADGHESIVQMLLDNGADVNAGAGSYGTALNKAAAYGHESIVQMLLDNGADVNAGAGSYGTALNKAAACGHESIVQMLLDNGADINAGAANWPGTALNGAAACGHESIVQMLLDNGADVNAGAGSYGTALTGAAAYGYESIVQMLLDNGADVNAGAGSYGTALTGAAANGHESIVQMLFDNGADINAGAANWPGTALNGAAACGHESIVQMLLDNGADVNAGAGSYGTALNKAAACGHESIVQMLLDNGADINARAKNWHGTALNGAAACGHESIVQMLLDKGADSNGDARGLYGTPLQAAVAKGHESIVQLLLNNGPNVNISADNYETALHIAMERRFTSIIKLLLISDAKKELLPLRTNKAMQRRCSL